MDRDVKKFAHLTSLDQIPDLSPEDKEGLDELFPDPDDLDLFVRSNKLRSELGPGRILAVDEWFPPQAEAYKKRTGNKRQTDLPKK